MLKKRIRMSKESCTHCGTVSAAGASRAGPGCRNPVRHSFKLITGLVLEAVRPITISCNVVRNSVREPVQAILLITHREGIVVPKFDAIACTRVTLNVDDFANVVGTNVRNEECPMVDRGVVEDVDDEEDFARHR